MYQSLCLRSDANFLCRPVNDNDNWENSIAAINKKKKKQIRNSYNTTSKKKFNSYFFAINNK